MVIRVWGKWVDVVYLNREGKYDHTCVVGLQNGALSSSSVRQVVFSILKDHMKYKFLYFMAIVFFRFGNCVLIYEHP